MKPTDITALRTAGRPALTADGTVVVAISHPDLQENITAGQLYRVRAAGQDGSAPVATDNPAGRPLEPFTHGPRDSEPVLSPAGDSVVFLRAVGEGKPQLWTMPLGGGEPRQLADHPLGAGRPAFSPDGRWIAYPAAVPEPGRYGTDASIRPEAEPPRRIDRQAYRLDGKGFVIDKPEQVFVLDLAGDLPARQLTAEPDGVASPVFTADGREVLYIRAAGPDRLENEIAAVAVDGSEPGRGRPAAPVTGSVANLVVHGSTLVYQGAEFAGNDYAGRTTGLWSVTLPDGVPQRLTDAETVDTDPTAGPAIIAGDRALVAVHDRGAVTLVAVPLAARSVPLAALPVLVGGRRVVRSFAAQPDWLVTVLADPAGPGELVAIPLDGGGRPAGPEQPLTGLAADLAGLGLARQLELTGVAPDGYPVHGFLVLPEGDGPHPVLLDVHGGPHAAYGWGVFDEAQVYAAAGYAVVLPNPRGSAGYGQDHGRSIIGRLGTVDVDDVLALLDAALTRPDCDAARVGVMGGSYGGFMTSWLASHAPDRFVAAISERAVNAWDSFAGSSDIGYFFAESYVGSDRDAQWAASPLAYADDIAVPLLIIHSEQDWRCPIEQGQRLFVALKTRGAEVEMLLFPGEGHELSRSGRPRHRQQRFDAILQWWGRHLPVD